MGWIFRSILILVLIALFINLVVFAIRRFNRRKKRKPKSQIDKKIALKIMKCEEHIRKIDKEIGEIKNEINDLSRGLNHEFEINPETKEESKNILNGFKSELKLRESKLGFYETCIVKLKTLQFNHQLHDDLQKKKAKLSELQEEHYTDLGDMETLKTELEYEHHYLDSIELLTSRMMDSNSVDAANEIRLELNEITKELKRL